MLFNRLLKFISILIIGLIIVIIFSQIVPFEMDEFAAYHPIMCFYYKANILNTFRESCSAYNLNFLNSGIILPLRANNYIGFFQSIIYLPIFPLWKDPLSARFLGYIFLILQAIILGKIFKMKYEHVLIGLVLFFPYFFQHIVDTGPISFQTTSIFLVYFLIIKWTQKIKIYPLLLITLLIFFGIATKLSYFWLLPGLFLIFLWEIIKNKKLIFTYKNLQKLCLGVSISILIFTLLVYGLFLSTDPGNNKIFPFLSEIINGPRGELYSISELIKINWRQLPIIKSLINPLEATQRIYWNNIMHNSIAYFYDFIVFLFLPFIILILMIGKKIVINKNIGDVIILYFSFLVSLFFIIFTRQAWAVHHLILVYPFLILFSIKSLTILKTVNFKWGKFFKFKYIITLFLILFCFLNFLIFITFNKQTVHHANDFSRIKINQILEDEQLAKSYSYVVIDWGMYYLQGLYGNINQSVIYLEPLNQISQIAELKNISNKSNRKLLFIYNKKILESDMDLIQKSFKLSTCKLIQNSTAWDILLEQDNSNNICF